MLRSSFQKLQKRFDSIPESYFKSDPDGYINLCEIILQEEGWSEEEYLGCVLRQIENGEVRWVQNAGSHLK